MLLTKPFLQQVWLSRSMIPAAQEAEKGESKVCDPSGLHSEFRASLGNLGSHCLKKKTGPGPLSSVIVFG